VYFKNLKIIAETLNYDSHYFTNNDNTTKNLFANEEIFSNYRYHRFDNFLLKYDYKSGDYFPKLYKEVYTYLFTSAIDVRGAVRYAP